MKSFTQLLYLTVVSVFILGAVVFQSCKELQRKPNKTNIEVVAHRGIWREFPENSLEGIERSIELGVDMVEVDLSMTKDSILILMHDVTLDRTTTGMGLVSENTYEDIKAMFLRDWKGSTTNFKVPTLEEAMSAAKGRIKVFVDKGYPYMKEALEILTETETDDQAFFLGFVSGEAVKKDYPLIYDQLDYMPLVKLSDSLENYLKSMEDISTTYFLFSFDRKEEAIFESIQKLPFGSRAMATAQKDFYCGGYTDSLSMMNPDAGWGFLIDQGFSAICTDRPKELIRYLQKRGLHDK